MTSSSPKKHRTTCPPPRTSSGPGGGAEQRFDADAGWVLMPNVLSDDEVATINDACVALLSVEPARRERRDKPAGGTRHLGDLRGRIPIVDALVSVGPLAAVVSEIVGADPIVGEVGFRCPQPGYGTQYLHADATPKLDDEPAEIATAIVTLCAFDGTNGATRIVPGSHRRPDLQRLSGGLESHPDEVYVSAPAGSAIVFSGHVLHSGTKNNSDSDRPSLQITWRRRNQKPVGFDGW